MEKLVMANHYLKAYSGKTVFVTGNTGFKGAWLCYWLHLLGAKVVGYAKDIPTKPSFFETLDIEPLLERQFWNDVRDQGSLQAALVSCQPDIVFHLAAQPIVRASIIDPIETFQTNALGTAYVLNTIKDLPNQVPAVIVTSDKCYENKEWLWGYRESDPLGGCDPYSASKAAAELIFSSMARTYPQLIAATGRAGNVIGGGDWAANRVVPDAVRSWKLGQQLEIRAPSATRPWQHVLEPLNGYLKLGFELMSGNPSVVGESFNFGPSDTKSYSVSFLLDEMLLRWPQTGCSYSVSADAGVEAGLLKLNCDKASALLNWKQKLSIFETIDYTVQWYWRSLQGSELHVMTKKQIDSFSVS